MGDGWGRERFSKLDLQQNFDLIKRRETVAKRENETKQKPYDSHLKHTLLQVLKNKD